jgi:O-antigen ligase
LDRGYFPGCFERAGRADTAMRMLRIGLCLLFAFSVLALGTVEVWSESILEIGAAALFLYWAIVAYRNSGAKVYWNPLNGPLLGLVGIGLLQLIFHGTAYPFLTRTTLMKLAAYFLVLFLTAQAFRGRKDLYTLAWFIIAFCFAVSLLAIIQHFTSGAEIYWMSDLKIEGEPWGPFVNRNHFAGFVELTLPMGLALMAFHGVRRDLVPLATLMTIVPISALILSASRAGIIGFGLEVGILVLLARSRKAWQGRRATAAAIVALAALAIVAWVGTGRAIERFSGSSVRAVTVSRRVSMFRAAAHIFLDHPIKGSGLGTLVDVFPAYENAYDGRLVDHAHNDYIEGLAETGLFGGLCGVVFLWMLYREGRKNFTAEQGHFSRGLHAAAIMAVCGLLLHSFVDFNLQIPANALFFLLQAYLVTAPPLPSDAFAPRERRRVEDRAAAGIRLQNGAVI